MSVQHNRSEADEKLFRDLRACARWNRKLDPWEDRTYPPELVQMHCERCGTNYLLGEGHKCQGQEP